jgi:hypothetical protein
MPAVASARVTGSLLREMLYCHFEDDDPFPRSVMRLLWERYPETREAFREQGIFVIEFQVGSVDFDEDDAVLAAEPFAEAAYAVCLRAHDAARVLFIAHARPDVARELAQRGVAVPAGSFLGACGYLEGGVSFYAADGTVIESDDWEAAREYVLRIAADRSPGSSASGRN